jgi:hypothetical protein
MYSILVVVGVLRHSRILLPFFSPLLLISHCYLYLLVDAEPN